MTVDEYIDLLECAMDALLVLCPNCEGSGEHQPGSNPQHVIQCPYCHGRGERLPDEAVAERGRNTRTAKGASDGR